MRRPHNPSMRRQTPYWTAALLAATLVLWAQDEPDVSYPQGHRSWQHVKSKVIGPGHKLYEKRGGFHHFYANDEAVEGYRTGKFPNGSVAVDEAVLMKEGEGDAKGITLEGERRALDVMVKKRPALQGDWRMGLRAFCRGNRTGVLPLSRA